MPRIEERATSDVDLEEVYRSHGPKLYRSMLLFTGDRELAADAVAEAFAQALRRGDALRSPAAWIWKTAYRVAAGELAERSRESRVPLEGAFELPDVRVVLSIAMKDLSPKQRASVALHDYAGYSLRETAAIIGSSASAVSVHLVRAHRKLKPHLEERDDA
jgi:RNA polymerase sigma-70 factor (ECF subfamily)